jgi:hypothetical protein
MLQRRLIVAPRAPNRLLFLTLLQVFSDDYHQLAGSAEATFANLPLEDD